MKLTLEIQVHEDESPADAMRRALTRVCRDYPLLVPLPGNGYYVIGVAGDPRVLGSIDTAGREDGALAFEIRQVR